MRFLGRLLYAVVMGFSEFALALYLFITIYLALTPP